MKLFTAKRNDINSKVVFDDIKDIQYKELRWIDHVKEFQ